MVLKYSLQDKNPVVMGLLVASHIGKLIWIVFGLSTLAAGFLSTSIILIKLATNMKNIKLSKDIKFLLISSFISLSIYQSIGMATLIALVLVVFFYKILKKKPEHKVYAQLLTIIFTISVIAFPFIQAVESDKEFRAEKQSITTGTSTAHRYVTAENSFERSIELKVLEIIGADSKINVIRISENELYIEYQAKENLNNRLTILGIYKDMVDMTEQLSKLSSDKFTSILYSPQLDLVDTYGNSSSERVSLVTIEKSTWEKINFSTFISSDIETIADTFYLHPALK